MTKEEREEYFRIFFNRAVEAVQSLDELQLRERIIELEKICLEARATLAGTGHVAREKQAKDKKAKGILANVSDINVNTEAIATLQRRERMSKVDKNIEAMMKLGMSREDAEKLYKGATITELKHKKHESQEKKEISKNSVSAELNALLAMPKTETERKEQEEKKPLKLNLSFLKK